MARYLRRTAFYKLSPPAVVTTPPSFVASPVQVKLARNQSRRPRRLVQATLYKPSIVNAPLLVGPVTTTLATLSKRSVVRRVLVHYRLNPPVFAPVAPFIAQGVTTYFGTAIRRAVQQHYVTPQLFSPEIINPLPVTFGPSTKLARSPRQGRVTHSVLRKPVVSGAVVVTPPFRSLSINFTTAVGRSARKLPALSSELRPPTVVSIPSGDNPTGGIFDPNYFLIIHS